LKPVNGGAILESQACLIANKVALRSVDDKLQLTRRILELIEAHLRARSFYSLTANIHGDSPEAIAHVVTSHGEVAGLQGPTVAPVYRLDGQSGWYAATIVVEDKVLQKAVDALRKAGAADVTAIPLRYVFQHKAWTFEALRRQLFGEAEDEEA